MPRRPADHGSLMVSTAHEVGAQSARVDLFQIKFLIGFDFRSRTHRGKVDRFSVCLGRQRDVVGVFVSSFDFDASDTDVDQFRDLLGGV